MLKSGISFSLVAALAIVAASLQAQEKTGQSAKCESGKCAAGESTTCAPGTCPSTLGTAVVAQEGKSCCASEKGTAVVVAQEGKSCCASEKGTAVVAQEGKSCCASEKGTAVVAQEGKSCCASEKGTAVAQEGQTCPITAAMEKLPKMIFVVGGEKTCCPTSAGELAKKSGESIHFIVAEKTFDSESKAKLALVEATEVFVNAFAEPKTCPQSGTITVAGKGHCCEKSATETTNLVKAAMDGVKMSYLVGTTECNCPVEAEKLAKDAGASKTFVVAGEKTCCDVTARLNLARAKYKAAVETLAKSNNTTN